MSCTANPPFPSHAFIVLQDILYDIATQAAMEFRVDNVWAAIPLISDTRLLLFNATTLTKLGLEFPPPHGLWNETAYGDSNVRTLFRIVKLAHAYQHCQRCPAAEMDVGRAGQPLDSHYQIWYRPWLPA